MQKTLLIKQPFGRTFGLSLFFLFLLLLIGELIMRIPAVQAPFLAPGMSSRHYQLGQKLALLESFERKHGHVNCIALGSSMVDVGFQPESFAAGYAAAAGTEPFHCFNFGIDASSILTAPALAKILLTDYEPELLIFGTDARDYAVTLAEEETAVILEAPGSVIDPASSPLTAG